MESNKLHNMIMFLLSVFILVAAAEPEDYWKAHLPNYPIPPFLKNLLTPAPEWDVIRLASVHDERWFYWRFYAAHEHHRTTLRKLGTDFSKELSAPASQLSLFFFQKDLRIEKLMNLNFRKPSDMAHFLPRHLADTIPFSSNNLSQILQKLSLNADSAAAQVVKATLEECEGEAVNGEENFCATSLESMIDFSLSRLGECAIPLSTNADEPRMKEYRVTGVTTKSDEIKGLVACHHMSYAYAVFFCHKTTSAVAYEVELTMTEDGSKTDAVAICHTDTSEWNPDHVAFRVLGVKPGEAPVCHFLEQGNVIWVPAM